jgi:hypothetical protein
VTKTYFADATLADVLPPQVTEVTISGSDSAHDPFNFSTVDGSGAQIGTVPVGGADTISITFSKDVDLTGTELTLQSARDGSFYSLDYVGMTGTTATWKLSSGTFAADQMVLRLSDSVTDGSSAALDGEWNNPLSVSDTGTSEFTSGDGEAGGGFTFYFAVLPGDFNLDNIVNFDDYQVLFVNYNTGPGNSFADGDADGDGYVNFDDFQALFVDYNLDFTEWPVAPQVVEVTIGGSSSTHSAFDFSTVDGSGGQLTTVPVGGADTISITFSEEVNLVGTELTLQSARTSSYYSLNYIGMSGNTATWRLASGVFGADQIILRLSDSIVDTGGVHLDGDWTNPLSVTDTGTSEFPSGDGTAGTGFEFYFTMLPGDFNRDNVVNFDDFSLLYLNYNQGPGKSFEDGDADGDGDVDFDDFSDMYIAYNFDFADWPS